MTVRFQAFHSIKAIGNREVLFNWSRTNPLGALDQVWRPTTRDELQQLLREYPERKLRLIGSGLSFEPIHSVYAEGSQALLVDLHHLRGQLDKTADTVTYLAGTPLDTVYADLIAMDRMLPASPGVIGIQTLGGALSTGTHGQGLHQSALCDAVAALTVMLASGDIIRVERTDPRFGAFVMGMGMLGILLDVTLNTVPNRIMRCTKFTTDYPFLLEHNERLNREHVFVKSWWFAWTGESHIWLVDPASDDEVARYRAGGSEPLVLEGDMDERMNLALNATIDATLQKMARDTKDEARAGEHFETVRRFKDASDLVGNVYQILCKGIPAPQINCEVAVPLERMEEALAILQAWQEANPGVLHYPFILRCTGPSVAWLSAAHDKSVCWIGFLVYLAADGTFVGGSMEQMRELQQLLVPLGGIPHFGKHLAMDLYDFPALLPRWHDFLALKRELDPHGRFENRWLGDLFANR
ncbi:D-arabinono-1,4-lactone oxidase [Aeromonas caviae]|jgi:FAD/FMN-containing dehydrogenase|uniref:D-arabinono-1,4-lactone oxidase n=1 Tax=Aeromonas TaxID=642 RepID=UPI000CD29DDD|nr:MULTISPECIES: D-arabinono-1,4-lactone oxidase [Aeromonas]AUV16444.1 FAD-binding protein [Aeromonas sp. ASNIH7]MDH1843723.1 FAD-binding protein [Aeromonas caviae]MDM5109671.1 FAD-binding protein [Aeromonas caviae]MDX7918396.1 D-arabinono-1,4-lactone oxidase [Aeromonas caviae]QLL87227.1 FAD-binding protein [Aeromonas caviae]